MTQQSLPGFTHRANAISKRASKARQAKRARYRLPVLQPELVPDVRFSGQATAGVPATRADCPTQRPCPHLRCRYHLALVDAEHRAGRPGLGSVPRDEKGLTLAVSGDAGAERPGTTVSPSWLQWRGLEVEREVKVYIDRDGGLFNVRAGMLEHWLNKLHYDELVLIFDEDALARAARDGLALNDDARRACLLARARLTPDGLAMDRALPEHVYGSSSALVLTRVRGVPSCALDEIDRVGEHTNEQTGDAVGRHRTLVAREVRRALGKAVRAAGEMGMTEGELMQGIAELRRQSGR